MKKYIDADYILDAATYYNDGEKFTPRKVTVDEILRVVYGKEVPYANVKEEVYAFWIPDYDRRTGDFIVCKCSRCGAGVYQHGPHDYGWYYCPSCGAKMKGRK